MSLDVYLKVDTVTHPIHEQIFIREDGQNKEITRAEWDKRRPNQEPFIVSSNNDGYVYSANITHNLSVMASYAGNLYDLLWRPEELFIKKAAELILPLEKCLTLLKSDPNFFEQFNPSNGWGDYAGLVNFVERYLEACKQYPNADILVSR